MTTAEMLREIMTPPHLRDEVLPERIPNRDFKPITQADIDAVKTEQAARRQGGAR